MSEQLQAGGIGVNSFSVSSRRKTLITVIAVTVLGGYLAIVVLARRRRPGGVRVPDPLLRAAELRSHDVDGARDDPGLKDLSK
ncbi:hypothetical protein [Prauserella flavalba]|uniref:hypothetical protein n=1 Tax=Prauserella flavalba TaxID=1477506 RepID=UPI0011B37796|nr:hypothetical protein [Prauserella flavalba]